jgi:eukaryotic-like serine/threonine-protein kinase
MDQPVTFLRASGTNSPEASSKPSLPADLLSQAVGRLRVLALLYAGVFFLGGSLPMLVHGPDRQVLLDSPLQWGPQVLAIGMALAVFFTLRSPRLPVKRALAVGIFFEIAASYGIAASELIDTRAFPDGTVLAQMGLSWVAVWTMLFTIVVPSPPRRALLAALASVSAVPVTLLVLIAAGLTPLRPDPGQFFFWHLFPYILVTVMAYVGARVVYSLGTEVRKARELGSYNLEEMLGEGGMGQVWRARHRMLARPAAIKLIRGGSLQGERIPQAAVQRFELEAQTIASLRSPHTVNLFDFGVDDRGVFYYVMELLEGLDADKLVHRFGPVPAPRAIHMLRQICHSLSEAESRGLVHRDIKPANIFLCRYGEEYDFVKVLDFGIVKAVGGVTAPANQTAEDVIPGTPAYMAPEQVIGGAIDHRTDIYALGCVAYWLVTGQQVFESPTSFGMLTHHTRTPPARPSTRSELPIPAALDQLILDCLEKDPVSRPQTARELSRRLGEIAAGEGWDQDRAKEWWERVRP